MRFRSWITARQYIDEGYSQKVADGHCEIWDDFPYSHIVSITDVPFDDKWPMTMTIDKGDCPVIGIKPDYQLYVDWIVQPTPTPPTESEGDR